MWAPSRSSEACHRPRPHTGAAACRDQWGRGVRASPPQSGWSAHHQQQGMPPSLCAVCIVQACVSVSLCVFGACLWLWCACVCVCVFTPSGVVNTHTGDESCQHPCTSVGYMCRLLCMCIHGRVCAQTPLCIFPLHASVSHVPVHTHTHTHSHRASRCCT